MTVDFTDAEVADAKRLRDMLDSRVLYYEKTTMRRGTRDAFIRWRGIVDKIIQAKESAT